MDLAEDGALILGADQVPGEDTSPFRVCGRTRTVQTALRPPQSSAVPSAMEAGRQAWRFTILLEGGPPCLSLRTPGPRSGTGPRDHEHPRGWASDPLKMSSEIPGVRPQEESSPRTQVMPDLRTPRASTWDGSQEDLLRQGLTVQEKEPAAPTLDLLRLLPILWPWAQG